MQWTGDAASLLGIADWFGEDHVRLDLDGGLTLNGATRVRKDQWVVLSPNNRLHVCIPGLFEEVHELALADPEDSDLANMQAGLNAARSASNYWKKMAQSLAARLGTELPQPPAA
jgi:hypothetical protein